MPELFEEVARAFADPEQLRDLADDDRQREANDESLEDGLGDEARPTTGETPAIDAYASASDTSTAQTVSPAITSPRSRER